MDNGWQKLSPEGELKRKRIENIMAILALYVFFPLWFIFLIGSLCYLPFVL